MACRSPRTHLYAWGISLLLVLTLSGCGARDRIEVMPRPTATPETSAPMPRATPESSALTPVAGTSEEDRPLLQLHVFNGQPPEPEFATTGPHFSLYRDGRVVTPAVYDWSTIIRPLQVTLLSEAGVQAILDEAQSSGVLDGRSFTNAPWVDDPYILLISQLGDEPVLVSAHVMGFVPDMESEENALSERLSAFSDKLFNLESWLPAESILEVGLPFQPERLQIATFPLSSSGNDSILTWPLDTPLAEFGQPGFLGGMRCFILEGAEMQAVLVAFDEAESLGYHQPLWLSDRQYYQIYPRLLPPGDPGCYVVGANVPDRVYSDDETIEHGTLPGNVLLSISLRGALTPEEQLRAFPLVTLLGDGSVVTPPQGEENLLVRLPRVTRISEAGIQMLLHEARASGLLDGELGFSTVDPSLPATVFEIFPDERRSKTVIVPGLGIDGSSGGFSAEESEARARLLAFVELATNIAGHLSPADILATDERYTPDLFQWVTQPAELSGLPNDAGPVRQLAWVSDPPVKAFGDPYSLPGSICATVGSDMLKQLEGASANTRWESDGYLFVIYLRALLPHERPCQQGDEIACEPAPGAVVTPAPDYIDHGTGAADAILRLDSFAPTPYGVVDGWPILALYGDGSLVTYGMIPAIAPGPALWPMVTASMTEEGIQSILKRAYQLGLLEADAEWHGNGDPVEWTALTLQANGKRTRTSVSSGACATWMPEAEVSARVAFWTLARQIPGILHGNSDSLEWFPEHAITSRDEPYVVTRIQIVVAPMEEPVDATPPSWPVIEWPLETPLAAFGEPVGGDGARCGVLAGVELDLTLPLILQANDETPWLSDGAHYDMWVRALLSDEAGCDMPGS